MLAPMRTARRSSLPIWLSAASAVALLSATSLADEDWRKLLDRQPPYAGPIVRGGAENGDPTRGIFDSRGIILQSWIPLNQFPDGANQDSAADCWGYVSPSGREYAIIGLRRGTAFVEVTDPRNPVIVGYIPGPNSLWHDVTVIGHHAYMVSEGGRGIQVADLSQIDSGVVTHLGDRMQAGHTTTHTVVNNPDSGYIYLCGTNINNGGLTAVSTADPANPTIVGAWTERYVHEATVVTYTDGPYAGREIAFCFTGGPAVSYSAGGGLDIVDVTDKSNMFTISSPRYPGVRFCHQGWPSEDLRYLYINDELDEGSTAATTTTFIYDISDLENPVFVGSFTNGNTAVDHNMYVKGNLIFAGNYRSGLRIYSAIDPENLHEIAYIDTYPADDNPGFNGVWGNYPYFPSGTIVLSDLERGLIVVRLDENALAVELLPSSQPGPLPERPFEVLARTSSLGEPTPAESATLMARINGGDFQPRPMIHLGGGLYRGTLPPAPCFATIEYYVQVQSQGGVYYGPVAGPEAPRIAEVVTGYDTLFEDDMETDRGWTVGDPVNPDTATAGIWNRMAPEPTSAQPGEDHTPDPGVICWVTDGRAGSGDGAWDVDNGKTTLVSPLIDLGGATTARIAHWRWYSNSAGAAPNSDVFKVEISPDDGATWAPVETVGPAGPGASGGWIRYEFNVADVVPPTSSVRLRFIAADEGDGSLVEAAVDDLSVIVPRCTVGCLADRDDNGVVNSNDISAFLAAWLADVADGTFTADFDGLAGTNSNDISAFLAVWLDEVTTGCR